MYRSVISFQSSFNALLKRGRSWHREPSRVAHLLSFAAYGEATGTSKSINVRGALGPTNKFY